MYIYIYIYIFNVVKAQRDVLYQTKQWVPYLLPRGKAAGVWR